MDRRTLAPMIDHTTLGPETTPADVKRILDEAEEHGMNACIPPCYLDGATRYAPDVTLVTVVGFPHGQTDRNAKRREGVLAWKAGADELDVVINGGFLREAVKADRASETVGDESTTDGDESTIDGDETVTESEKSAGLQIDTGSNPSLDDRSGEPFGAAMTGELAELVAAVPIPVKVILETALLDDREIRRACQAAVEADAAMVKTSTGFADGGATVEDVALMSEYLPVKASGGIGSYEEAMAMIDAGADRIGASSGVQILDGTPR